MIRKNARFGSRGLRFGLATSISIGALLAVVIAGSPASADVTKRFLTPSNLCLDNRFSVVAPYNPVQVWTCNGTAAQTWTYVNVGSTIRLAANPGWCVDVYAGGTSRGTKVDLYPCNNTGAQVWIWRSDSSMYNPQSNKCLDVPNNGGSGTRLQIWDCNGSAAQKFR